jgi:hypothetical protein
MSSMCEGFSERKLNVLTPNGGDACGCRYLLEGGAVVITFVALGLRVKTLDLVVSTSAACTSLPS